MPLDRRLLLRSFATLAAGASLRPLLRDAQASPAAAPPREPSLRRADGAVDWQAVRALFPLTSEWTHFASFLLVSHPKPVAEAVERYRRQLDADPYWIELALFTDEVGQPLEATKRALAGYVGGEPGEICLTSNTTSALAMAYHGLRIRPDQEIVTTEHDHYAHHESIRHAAERSRCGVRRIALYDAPASASAAQMVERVARAIRPRTRAVGLTWVHSSTGVKVPVAEIAAVVARANRGRAAADRCLLVVDGVHGFANQDVDVARSGADFFAAGTHKWLFAPRGTGFLWGRADAWPELRPTVPTFDSEELFVAWMDRTPAPVTRASHVSPGGFLAYEHVFAVPAAVELHRTIGRANIAARVAELNAAFREGAARIPGVTLHTPRDAALSGGISCFEVAGMTAEAVTKALMTRRFRTMNSPYKQSYARVAAGIMNTPGEVDAVLGAIRSLAGRTAG